MLLAILVASGFSFAIHDGEGWAVVRCKHHVTMSGDIEDVERVRKLVEPPFLWFRREGKDYVVTDPAVLDEIDELSRPQEELGKKQGELGKEQAKLGKRQAKLGMRQGDDSGDRSLSDEQ